MLLSVLLSYIIVLLSVRLVYSIALSVLPVHDIVSLSVLLVYGVVLLSMRLAYGVVLSVLLVYDVVLLSVSHI